jgi:valyl-tRNA synthetase
MIVSATPPEKCGKCQSSSLKQDEDVLDTWFSSALWPFSTLGWPEETEDLKYFFPTDVLVTGYDIIFFWVVRMVFSSLEMMGEVPFKYVYVHGLVRDAEGRKMSKSLGNGVDPLEIIDQFGADALRFMLMTGITPGNDMRFKTDKLESSRNFANKLWNASRFVIMNLQDENGEFRAMADDSQGVGKLALQDEDKWILSKVNEAVREATVNMEKFELSLAAQKAYELIWNEYCDWYIELVKGRLYGEEEEDKKVARYVLVRALKDMLKLLHPFMPFITEEIWSFLPKSETGEENPEGFLIRENWPVYDSTLTFETEVKKLELAMEAIRSIRNIRAEAEAAPSKKLSAVILSSGKDLENIKGGERYIKSLANITEITFITEKSLVPEEVMSAVIGNVEIYIPLDDLLDYKAEYDRLQKEETRLSGEVERVRGKLANEGFVSKAPEKVINDEREKLVKYEDMLVKIKERLALVEKKL